MILMTPIKSTVPIKPKIRDIKAKQAEMAE